jgi:hypothetical protein
MKSSTSPLGLRLARRRGASLAELLVVMSAASIILTMSAVLTHRIMHTQSKARAVVDVERTSLRLANALRGDIHLATDATVADAARRDGTFLQLTLPESQRIEYRREGAVISRILLAGERVVSRDAFAFPDGIELSIRKEGPRLVEMSIHSRPGEMPTEDGQFEASAYAVPVNLQVAAALDRDSLFTATARTPGGQP